MHHHVACLKCYYCLRGMYTLCDKFPKTYIEPGGFAEFFKVPASNLQMDTLKLPDEVSFEEATLIEPIACCVRALTKCETRLGDSVAIIGAGPSGIINAVLSKFFGAATVIVSDFVEFRLKVATKFGADKVVNPSKSNLLDEVKNATDGRGADLVVVTAPTIKAFSEAIEVCENGVQRRQGWSLIIKRREGSKRKTWTQFRPFCHAFKGLGITSLRR